jgi:hypothetical protein
LGADHPREQDDWKKKEPHLCRGSREMGGNGAGYCRGYIIPDQIPGTACYIPSTTLHSRRCNEEAIELAARCRTLDQHKSLLCGLHGHPPPHGREYSTAC